MPSVIKVDQIQSDTGTVNLTSNVAFSGSASTMQIGNALYLANTNNFALQFQPDVAGRLRIASSVSSFGDNNPFLIERPSSVGIQNDAITIRSGGVVDLGKGQLKFPASQNASADANTLDDYEEGTWTPTINSGITSPTYSAQFGTYTKIGNVVTFSLRIDVSGGTRNGNILNFTLPFVAKTLSNNTGSASWAYVSSGVISSTTTNLPTLYVNSNASSIGCYRSDGATFLGTDLVSTTPAFYLGGSYFTE